MRERRWGLLALAHYQAGNQSEALRSIRHVRALLTDRLGLDPSPELDALERAILRQDPTLAVDEAQRSSYDRCPYLGLRSYDVDDSESFFGREGEVSECLRRLEVEGALAVADRRRAVARRLDGDRPRGLEIEAAGVVHTRRRLAGVGLAGFISRVSGAGVKGTDRQERISCSRFSRSLPPYAGAAGAP